MDIFVYLLLLISPLNLCIALTFCTIMLVLVLYYHIFCKYSKRLKIMAISFEFMIVFTSVCDDK